MSDCVLMEKLIKEIKKNYKNATSLPVSQLVKVLKFVSDAYYNSGEPLVEDNVYDFLRDELERKDPKNEYLSTVGAPVKGTKEKVKLPYEMSSLTKIKPDMIGDLERWKKKFTGPYVLMDKLDGASAQLYKTENGVPKLYSRGDLINGQDISHLIKFFFKQDVLDKIPNGTSVRGELIIQKKKFKQISSFMKNARNAVSGLVNSKTVDGRVASITDFVAYSVMNPRFKQLEQLKKLEKMGLNVVYYESDDDITMQSMEELLLKRKEKTDYEMDGIVCADNSKIYEHKGGYPEHVFAFKMIHEDQMAVATVEEVIWNVSMDGYLVPKVRIQPVDLVGTTVTFATAHNAKFIVENNIGPGAQIKIIRSGDVIPYILKIVKQSTSGKPQMPDYKHKWNKSGVNLILNSKNDKKAKQMMTIKKISYFFKTMGIKYISEGIVTKFVENGFDSIEKILEADKEQLNEIGGVGSKLIDKIYKEIDRAFEETTLATFMAASHKFGRGMGERKLVEVLNEYPDIMNEDWDDDELMENLLKIHGYAEKTAKLFVNNFDSFKEFYEKIGKIRNLDHYENESDSDSESMEKIFDGKTIVFTGFRDKELSAKIVKLGGKVTDAVSGKTNIVVHADNADLSSSKIKKAQTLKLTIMARKDFMKKFDL